MVCCILGPWRGSNNHPTPLSRTVCLKGCRFLDWDNCNSRSISTNISSPQFHLESFVTLHTRTQSLLCPLRQFTPSCLPHLYRPTKPCCGRHIRSPLPPSNCKRCGRLSSIERQLPNPVSALLARISRHDKRTTVAVAWLVIVPVHRSLRPPPRRGLPDIALSPRMALSRERHQQALYRVL